MKKFLSMMVLVATILIGIESGTISTFDREKVPEPVSIIIVDKF